MVVVAPVASSGGYDWYKVRLRMIRWRERE